MNPLSAIFAGVVALRNKLYDSHALTVHRLSRPVISVGNISVGGSGKTPFVVALGKLLKQRGITFDVLSRGYRRQSKEIVVVNAKGSPRHFGDEPLLIARSLGVPVIVGADRYQAGLLAESRFPDVQLHLLDDGFQHRRLHRDFDIVLLTAADAQDTLLPTGRLREPPASLHRAHAIVNAPPGLPLVPQQQQQQWRATRRLVDVPKGQKVLAFCGLGHPRQFFQSLQESGANVVETMVFPDHHIYRPADIRRLFAARKRAGADLLVTTQKDEINLGALTARLEPLFVVPLEMDIVNSDELLNTLMTSIHIAL
jgi:tetraacyldisaccharide 4'-kinase